MTTQGTDYSELVTIAVSVLGISYAFSYVWQGFSFGEILLTVGTGFVLHELGHKYVAQSYGAHARYQMWTIGLAVAVVMAVAFNFVFAAPGAVYVYGKELTQKQSGRVALAGPAVNILLCLVFLFLSLTLTGLGHLLLVGARTNAFLGAFNLIPMEPFDGAKVYRSDKIAWTGAFALAGLLVILS